jgi:hypothetical protein
VHCLVYVIVAPLSPLMYRTLLPVRSNSSNSQPKYICPSNRIPGRILGLYKNDMVGEVTLSIPLDAVLLPKRDKADADLKSTEEDRRGCFDRHDGSGESNIN